MIRVSLEQWRMFRAVVEYGGFNQASQHIYKSQSSIHNAVSKIEVSLGVKLFYVEGRKTHLTQDGKLMLRRANYLLDEAEKIETVGQSLGKGVESQLNIAIDEVFPQKVLYQTLETVSVDFPFLQIELIETVLSGSTELFDQLEVDIAVSAFPVKEGVIEPLCDVDFVAVASASHPLHKISGVLELEDLKGHRQIVIRDSSIKARRDSGWLGADQRWTVSHLKTSIDMISNGLGYAWLPVSSIQTELDSGQLKALNLITQSGKRARLFLAYKDRDSLGPAAQKFLTELRANVESFYKRE